MEPPPKRDYVMVPVPTDRVLDVYAFLTADLPDGGPSEPAARWDERTLELVLREASPTIQALARHLADHPGAEVTTTEAADALGLRFGWNSLAGALGAFGRYLRNRGLELPWDVWYDPEDGRARMLMDRPTATAIRSIFERAAG